MNDVAARQNAVSRVLLEEAPTQRPEETDHSIRTAMERRQTRRNIEL